MILCLPTAVSYMPGGRQERWTMRMVIFSLAVAGAVVAVAIGTSGGEPIHYGRALLAGLVAFTFSAIAYRMNAARNA
jgi:hypothetical protein